MTDPLTQVAQHMRVDIWSDIACPWCYIGKRRFEAALAEFEHRDDIELTWHSFELQPDGTSTPAGGHAAHLAEKYGRTLEQANQMLDDMTATAAKDGLVYRFDIAQGSNTFDAHRLLHFAHERGLQDQLKEALMRAMFTEGRSVADHESLTEIAAEAGLDRSEVSAVLAGNDYAAAVRADEAQARSFGINGVPFFVIDEKYGVSGAQPSELLHQALEQAWNERSPLTVLRGGGDACEGDNCAV
jgi:predicted DsbA family dithiol-disulfide isomerase